MPGRTPRRHRTPVDTGPRATEGRARQRPQAGLIPKVPEVGEAEERTIGPKSRLLSCPRSTRDAVETRVEVHLDQSAVARSSVFQASMPQSKPATRNGTRLARQEFWQ